LTYRPRGRAEVRALGMAIACEFDMPIDPGGRQRRRFELKIGDQARLFASVTAQSVELFGRRAVLYLVVDETALHDAELRAMTASRLALVGELSVSIVHELSRPLAVIHTAATTGHL